MTELELTVAPGAIASAQAFFRAGVDLVSLLDELTDVPIDWVLSDLRVGSAVASISSATPDVAADAALTNTVHGLQLVRDQGVLPTAWGPDAVSAARRLAGIMDAGSLGSAPVQEARLRLVDASASDQPTIDLTHSLATRLAELQPFERTMPGAVRGQLVGLNVSRGNRASLKDADGRVVRVAFGDDLRLSLRERLYESVELVGDIRQDAEGRVFHVAAHRVRSLAEVDLRWSQLFGVDPDFTGGLTAQEFLEASRGEA